MEYLNFRWQNNAAGRPVVAGSSRQGTRYAVAKYAHVSKRTVDFLKARENGPTLDRATRLLDMFGMRFTIVQELPDRQI